ncbi:type VII secretion-associated serine protease mycosin [Dactylosporangium sp. CS-047395]|uniref:type VII secretion-associated serine protease mycosin n=1 Tax=Dactylosporangium sp. CS-047395 TaxID=3239936 RepID=UPI003D924411
MGALAAIVARAVVAAAVVAARAIRTAVAGRTAVAARATVVSHAAVAAAARAVVAVTARAVVAAAAVAIGALLVAPHPAVAGPPPPGVCDRPAEPGEVVKETPWPQRTFGTDRIAPAADGKNITVAVIDSGVDAAHPQLAGQVLTGFDFLRDAPGADFDCTSHGTAVASLIAASPTPGVGFAGLAPGAKILPIRVSDREEGTTGEAATPEVFAKAIRYAADQGARIINISLSLDRDYPTVAAAVDYAIHGKGALVVAAVGNHHVAATPPPIGAAQAAMANDPASYPANYPDVLGVAGINQDGTRLDESQIGTYVDIAAPGNLVLGATRERGHQYWKGTSFAAPLVSATAALVWSAEPGLSNADVAWRLEATADRMAGSARSPEFGYGLIDPTRALSEHPPRPETAATPPPIPPAHQDPATAARNDRWRTTGHIAALTGLGLLLAAGLALTMRTAVRHGRNRDKARPKRHRDPDTEPEDDFYALPTPSDTAKPRTSPVRR